MRVALITLMLLLSAASFAQAGTSDAPEIEDPAGDHKLTGGAPDAEELVKSVDLIKGWVTATEIGLELRLEAAQQMRGGQVGGNPTTQYEYTFNFKSGETAYQASAEIVGPAPPTVTPGGVATEAFIDPTKDSILVLVVPFDAIGAPVAGDAITELYANSKVFYSSGTIGTDRAPDSGFGLDFVLPADEPDVIISYQNITDLPFLVEATNATTGVFQYNWTGESGLQFTGNVVEGNLSLNVTVNGEPILAWADNGTLNETLPRHVCIDQNVTPIACHFSFTYTLDGFVGTYGIDLWAEDVGGNETEVPEDLTEGNDTDTPLDADIPGKESPAIAFPLLVLAIIVIARRK